MRTAKTAAILEDLLQEAFQGRKEKQWITR